MGRAKLDKPHSCNYKECNFETKFTTDLTRHYYTNHATDKEKEDSKWYCKYCKTWSPTQGKHDSHLETKKHKLIIDLIEE